MFPGLGVFVSMRFLFSVAMVCFCNSVLAGDAALPVVIDDEAIIKKLEKDGPELLKKEKAKEFGKLSKQLKRKSVELKLAAGGGQARGLEDIYRTCQPGVLVLGLLYKCKECPDWHASAASAFVLTADGVCASNYHVFESDPDDDIKAVVAMTSDGTVMPVTEILAANKVDDVALFRIDAGGNALTPLPLGEVSPPPGARVAVISHPAEHFFTYATGMVSRYAKVRDEDGSTADAMYITADFARGSSGSPVLDERGAVVGIVASTESCYYDDDGEKQKDLQMVFKACVPVHRIRALIKNPDK